MYLSLGQNDPARLQTDHSAHHAQLRTRIQRRCHHFREVALVSSRSRGTTARRLVSCCRCCASFRCRQPRSFKRIHATSSTTTSKFFRGPRHIGVSQTTEGRPPHARFFWNKKKTSHLLDAACPRERAVAVGPGSFRPCCLSDLTRLTMVLQQQKRTMQTRNCRASSRCFGRTLSCLAARTLRC